LLKIISFKTALNRGISQKIKENFPNAVFLDRPAAENPPSLELNNNWIAGFCAGEGSFSVSIHQTSDRKLPIVRARFAMGLHAKDKQLLIKIQNQFNTGYTRTAKANPAPHFSSASAPVSSLRPPLCGWRALRERKLALLPPPLGRFLLRSRKFTWY